MKYAAVVPASLNHLLEIVGLGHCVHWTARKQKRKTKNNNVQDENYCNYPLSRHGASLSAGTATLQLACPPCLLFSDLLEIQSAWSD